MTQLWHPYRHKLDGRSYEDRIGRPYYGSDLRRVLAPEPTDPSFIERITDWWLELPLRTIVVLCGCIVVAILSAALIVVVAR